MNAVSGSSFTLIKSLNYLNKDSINKQINLSFIEQEQFILYFKTLINIINFPQFEKILQNIGY